MVVLFCLFSCVLYYRYVLIFLLECGLFFLFSFMSKILAIVFLFGCVFLDLLIFFILGLLVLFYVFGDLFILLFD